MQATGASGQNSNDGCTEPEQDIMDYVELGRLESLQNLVGFLITFALAGFDSFVDRVNPSRGIY